MSLLSKLYSGMPSHSHFEIWLSKWRHPVLSFNLQAGIWHPNTRLIPLKCQSEHSNTAGEWAPSPKLKSSWSCATSTLLCETAAPPAEPIGSWRCVPVQHPTVPHMDRLCWHIPHCRPWVCLAATGQTGRWLKDSTSASGFAAKLLWGQQGAWGREAFLQATEPKSRR